MWLGKKNNYPKLSGIEKKIAPSPPCEFCQQSRRAGDWPLTVTEMVTVMVTVMELSRKSQLSEGNASE